MSDPTPAADETVVSVLDTFAVAGWPSNHLVRGGALAECGVCGEATRADAVDVEAVHRLEGASEPADLQMAIGWTCPHCGAGGTIIVGYGPNASDTDADMLAAIDLDTDPADPVAAT